MSYLLVHTDPLLPSGGGSTSVRLRVCSGLRRRATRLLRALLRLAVTSGLVLAAAVWPMDTATAQLSDPLPSPDAGGDLPILHLEDLLRDVRDSNPSLRASYLEAAALETRTRQVAALPDPMLMSTYQPFPLMTARGTQRSQWRVEQTIPYPGKLALQGEIATLGAEVALSEARALEEDLIQQTKQLYFELYRIRQQTALVEDFQARLHEFEQVALTQYEVGTGDVRAILKAQVEKNSLSQRLIELNEQQTTVVESLARLVNRFIPRETELRIPSGAVILPGTDDLVAIARTMRPEMDALAAKEQQSDRQVDLGRKQFLPDVGVNVTYFDLAASDMMPSATGRDALAVGVAIKIPLQRDRLRAQIEEAEVRRAQVQARVDALETSFTTEIADLTNQIRRDEEQLDLYQTLLLPQAEASVEAAVSAYTTGQTDFLDLLDSERMLFQIRMGQEDTRTRRLKSVAALERVLGLDSLEQLQERESIQSPVPDIR